MLGAQLSTMNRALLCLVLFSATSLLQGADLEGSATEKKIPAAGTVAQVEESRRGTWSPRKRTVGWGANKGAGALRIKEGDRKKPARDRPEWAKWRKGKGARRTYRNATDEEYHARIFEETEAMVAENQAAFARGEASYELEINKFADYSEEEIAHLGIGEVGRRAALEYLSNFNETQRHDKDESTNIRRSKRSNSVIIDWRASNMVPPIRDQGDCGSCYAFAAVAAIETHVNIKFRDLQDLSEQQVVDCSGDNGCWGGWHTTSYNYVMRMTSGLVTEKVYPYKGTKNSCPALPKGIIMSKIWSYVEIPPGNETEILRVLRKVGPVSVVMDAEQPDFDSYKKGIYNNPNCQDTYKSLSLHAVLIVGAGTANGVDYWIVRNSWGTTWGEKGYMKIKRGVNMCGLADAAAYPSVHA